MPTMFTLKDAQRLNHVDEDLERIMSLAADVFGRAAHLFADCASGEVASKVHSWSSSKQLALARGQWIYVDGAGRPGVNASWLEVGFAPVPDELDDNPSAAGNRRWALLIAATWGYDSHELVSSSVNSALGHDALAMDDDCDLRAAGIIATPTSTYGLGYKIWRAWGPTNISR